MRYAVARYEKEKRDMVYRIYTTDCLRMLNEGVYFLCGGSCDIKRYADVVYGSSIPEEDNRTGDEIANDIIKRAGIEVI